MTFVISYMDRRSAPVRHLYDLFQFCCQASTDLSSRRKFNPRSQSFVRTASQRFRARQTKQRHTTTKYNVNRRALRKRNPRPRPCSSQVTLFLQMTLTCDLLNSVTAAPRYLNPFWFVGRKGTDTDRQRDRQTDKWTDRRTDGRSNRDTFALLRWLADVDIRTFFSGIVAYVWIMYNMQPYAVTDIGRWT